MAGFILRIILGVLLSASIAKGAKETAPKIIKFEISKSYPHDPNAFTQGLEIWDEGFFLESTGRYGQSDLRRVEIKTGYVEKKTPLDSRFFGEGVTRWKKRILQLTWREGSILEWSFQKNTGFQQTKTFPWKGEGWGLTSSPKNLWISDGSSNLFEVDPVSLTIKKTLPVTMNGKPLDKLNELEWVQGRILANIWYSDTVVAIDPSSGVVTGLMDLASLWPTRSSLEMVTNGIAWDVKHKKLYVTGKLWPHVFELKLKDKIP